MTRDRRGKAARSRPASTALHALRSDGAGADEATGSDRRRRHLRPNVAEVGQPLSVLIAEAASGPGFPECSPDFGELTPRSALYRDAQMVVQHGSPLQRGLTEGTRPRPLYARIDAHPLNVRASPCPRLRSFVGSLVISRLRSFYFGAVSFWCGSCHSRQRTPPAAPSDSEPHPQVKFRAASRNTRRQQAAGNRQSRGRARTQAHRGTGRARLATRSPARTSRAPPDEAGGRPGTEAAPGDPQM
jgi:hypothetical protein